MRGSRYSVPAAYAGRTVDVRLGGGAVTVLAEGRVVARHERSAHRGAELLVLDHYLEVLSRKPGALPGAVALKQARASGSFTTAHERFWKRTRRRLGDREGTRALIEVLLLHRSLPFVAVHAALDAVERVGSVDPALVAIEGAAHRRRPPRDRRRGAAGAEALRPPGTEPGRLRRAAGRERAMSAPLTEQAAALTVEATCRALRLPTVREQAGPLAEAALRDRLSHLAYLAELLQAELDDRDARRRERRIHEARFPRLKHLADFDLAAAPTVDPTLIAALESCEWVERGEPVALLGDSGTGKSHLLIGLGVAACQRGLRVRYTTAAQLVNELAEAADERTLSRLVARYGRLDLLCLDELGYLQLDRRGAELLFQVLTEREERASVAVASNAPFLGVGRDLRRPPARGRCRRPAHLPRPHHRDRQRVLPPARHEGGEVRRHADHDHGVGPELIITVGPNGVVIPTPLISRPVGSCSSTSTGLRFTEDGERALALVQDVAGYLAGHRLSFRLRSRCPVATG